MHAGHSFLSKASVALKTGGIGILQDCSGLGKDSGPVSRGLRPQAPIPFFMPYLVSRVISYLWPFWRPVKNPSWNVESARFCAFLVFAQWYKIWCKKQKKRRKGASLLGFWRRL